MTDPLALKSCLDRTWLAFFARHGSFTRAQLAAIPPILDGENVLLIAATASGKTEAALAPLLERHCLGSSALAPDAPQLRILYVCPTRALVRDLYERLKDPCASLGVSLAMKSGDTGPVSTASPPALLITTPESTDSLLTRAPRLLGDLRAILLDEIHLFDRGPRGDHLRCLLRRIDVVRRYRSEEAGEIPTPLQRVALSATVPDPAGIAARYLTGEPSVGASGNAQGHAPRVVEVSGSRPILAQMEPMTSLDDLALALDRRAVGGLGVRKSLVFCNTRHEVEQTAAYLRNHLPFAATVFTHYSNLDPGLRLEVEQGFAEAAVAICVSTSTLELGIDIGSIDDVVLVGPPPDLTAFLQRIGRGSRRRDVAPVLCLPRSPLEEARFRGLLEMAERPLALPPVQTGGDFLPSVLVQQTFSILKQSPTGGLRLGDLRRVAPGEVTDGDLGRILNHLRLLRYLRPGRPGEWRPGPALDELVDAHEIYSNIGGDPLSVQVVDSFSGRVLAQTRQRLLVGDRLRLGGRTLAVLWRDGYRAGVREVAGEPGDVDVQFQTSPFAVPVEVSQAVARHVGLAPARVAVVAVAEGCWLFHFWGDLYGAILAEQLGPLFASHEEAMPVTRINEHCLYLPGPLGQLPRWNPADAQRALHRILPQVEPLLELGRFHSLLPAELAQRTVIARCDLPRYEQIYRQATLVHPSSGLRSRLEGLL